MAPSLRDLDIAVLAGGLGTRLASVVSGLPKILAPVGNRPFLDYFLLWLAANGATRVLLCLGHRADAVQEYLARSGSLPVEVSVVVETMPLGTAGAVNFALPHLRSDPVLILNGDSYVDAALGDFLREHLLSGALASILCAQVPDSGRYGRVEIDSHQHIAQFREKDGRAAGAGWISAGVYAISQRLLSQIAAFPTGSLERDVLEVLPAGTIHAFRTTGQFLDIGTPEALASAAELFSRRFVNCAERRL